MTDDLSVKKGNNFSKENLFVKYNYLHCRLMLCKWIHRGCSRSSWGIPYINHVVVPPTGKVFAIRAPLEPTHFLGVTLQACYMVVGDTDVMVVYLTGSGTTEKNKSSQKVNTNFHRFTHNLCGESWPSSVLHWTEVLMVESSECGFESWSWHLCAWARHLTIIASLNPGV